MFTKLLVGLLLCLSLAQGVRIVTSEYETVYADGQVEKGWDTSFSATRYSRLFSVAEFSFISLVGYEYDAPQSSEVISEPVIEIIQESDVISPILQGEVANGFKFDGYSYYEENPTLRLIFNCIQPGEATLAISLNSTITVTEEGKEPISNTETIKFYFAKECKNTEGHRPGFNIGYGDVSNNVVSHGVVQTKWLVESDYDLYPEISIVTMDDPITTFHISMSENYGNQYFSAPKVWIEDEETLQTVVRGAYTEGVATVFPTSFSLVHTCLKRGLSDIVVSISLGFYGELRFGFVKACGEPSNYHNNLPSHVNQGYINVGTSRSEYASIVERSETSLYWRINSSSVVVQKEDILTNLYISAPSGQTQEVLKPIVTIDPPVFGVSLSGAFRDGGVATGVAQPFTINYLCKRNVEAQVTVTLKLPGTKTVEFSYLKKCQALKRHKGHVWTANQAMVVFVIFMLVIGFIAFKYCNKPTTQTKKTVRP